MSIGRVTIIQQKVSLYFLSGESKEEIADVIVEDNFKISSQDFIEETTEDEED